MTSRDDSKVRLPLQKYHPQIFDLEAYVKEKNSDDLLLYARGELSNLHPTEEQVQQIVDKSQGVFLYLSLCVEGIHNSDYSLVHLDKLPDGLNGYYYELFTRQFGNDIKGYRENIAPILQLMVATKKNLHLPFIKYLLGISDSKLYEACLSLEHICRITTETGNEVISFFHNSVENWLTNHRNAGIFFISNEEGNVVLSQKFKSWVTGDNNNADSLWEEFGDGIKNICTLEIQNIHLIKEKRLLNILNTMKGIQRYTNQCFTPEWEDLLKYCKRLLNDAPELMSVFVDKLFEAVKESLINIDFASPKDRMFHFPTDMKRSNNLNMVYRTICYTAIIGSIGRLILYNYKDCPNRLLKELSRYIRILAFYDRRIGEFYFGSGISDMGDSTAMELEALEENLINHSNS